MLVVKEYNLRLLFDTKHRDKNSKFSLHEKQQIVQELNSGLQSQKNMFTKATAKNNVLPFEGNHIADVAFGENEFDTLALKGST